MSKKLKATIIGPGNIGTDLLMKMQRSEWIEPAWMLSGGVTAGPLLVGSARPAHILTNASTAHGIVNMSALAVVEAQSRARA